MLLQAARAQGHPQGSCSPTSGSPTRSSSTSALQPRSSTPATPSARSRARHRGARRSTTYADKLWDYWERNLDPDLFKDRSFERRVNGKTVVITGASSGIGQATALKVAAAGGTPILVARGIEKLEETQREIEKAGGQAYSYPCDLTDLEAIEHARREGARRPRARSTCSSTTPAARSAARSSSPTTASTTSSARCSSTTSAPIKLIMGLLPHMSEQQARPHRQRLLDRRADQPAAVLRLRRVEGGAGRVHAHRRRPRWSATAITFTTIHMPLVRTPMIAPTKIYDSFPTITPDEAADMICDAIAQAAEADQHAAGHVRRGRATRWRPRPSTRCCTWHTRSSPTHRGQGREGRRRAAGQRRGDGDGADPEGRALVSSVRVERRVVAVIGASKQQQAVVRREFRRASFRVCGSARCRRVPASSKTRASGRSGRVRVRHTAAGRRPRALLHARHRRCVRRR